MVNYAHTIIAALWAATAIQGNPDPDHNQHVVCRTKQSDAAHVVPPHTRLTNAFSEKAENHARAVALHIMHYNFGRVHKSVPSGIRINQA